jgi:hypothetical protein
VLLKFSSSKFPRENHAVKIPKDAFSLVVDYYKDNVSKDRAYFRKSNVSGIITKFCLISRLIQPNFTPNFLSAANLRRIGIINELLRFASFRTTPE